MSNKFERANKRFMNKRDGIATKVSVLDKINKVGGPVEWISPYNASHYAKTSPWEEEINDYAAQAEAREIARARMMEELFKQEQARLAEKLKKEKEEKEAKQKALDDAIAKSDIDGLGVF